MGECQRSTAPMLWQSGLALELFGGVGALEGHDKTRKLPYRPRCPTVCLPPTLPRYLTIEPLPRPSSPSPHGRAFPEFFVNSKSPNIPITAAVTTATALALPAPPRSSHPTISHDPDENLPLSPPTQT